MRQAEERRYAEGLAAYAHSNPARGNVLVWGIAFDGKHVAVASKHLA